MSIGKTIKTLFDDAFVERNCFTEEHAVALWAEVRAYLESHDSLDTIKEVEAFTGRRLDTHPRDIVSDAICFVLTGVPYLPDSYPGSPFAHNFLKECFKRGYIETDRAAGPCPSLRFFVDAFDGVEHIRREVVPASLYDQAQEEIAELRRQLEGKAMPAVDQLSADRWNALLSSQRMRVLGYAGFTAQEDPVRNQAHLAGHRHLGVDLWSHHDADDGAKERAVEMITAYADQLIKNNQKPSQEG